jgi:hypothetical protein
LDSKLEDRRSCTEWYQAFPDFNLLLISSWMEFRFVRVVPKYLNCSTLLKDLLSTFMWHHASVVPRVTSFKYRIHLDMRLTYIIA